MLRVDYRCLAAEHVGIWASTETTNMKLKIIVATAAGGPRPSPECRSHEVGYDLYLYHR